MKTLLTTIMMLLATYNVAHANNTITVDNLMLPQDGEADLVVRFNVENENSYSGYQFDITLPDGIEFVTNDKGNVVCTLGNCYEETPTLTPNLDNGVLKVACFTANSNPILGTTGILVTFKVSNTTTKDVGTIHNGEITGVKLSTVSAESITLSSSSFTITIDEPDDGRIKFDETSTSLPTYTAGEKGNVTLKRTITAGQWSTIVLPFTLTKAKAETAFGADVQLAEFTAWEADYGDDDENVVPLNINMTFSTYTMSAKKPMTGGKPFLIKTSQDIATIEADDVTLFRSVTDISKTDEYDTAGKMTGTLVKTVIPEDGLFVSNQTFYYSVGTTNIKAFRCWMELGAVLDKETDFSSKISFVIDDEVTSVDGIESKFGKNDIIYSLDGKAVAKGTDIKRLPKGVYIVNGKKYVVR